MTTTTIDHTDDRPTTAADAYALGNLPRVGWFSTGSGRIELVLTLADAESGSQPGKDASDDVAALLKVPYIAEQLADLSPDLVRGELSEWGAWDDDELADHDANLTRLVWIACGDIRENAT
jgi:hypothetical protein